MVAMGVYCRSGREMKFIRVEGGQGVKEKWCERGVHLNITFHRVMAALSVGRKTRSQSPQWVRGLGQ